MAGHRSSGVFLQQRGHSRHGVSVSPKSTPSSPSRPPVGPHSPGFPRKRSRLVIATFVATLIALHLGITCWRFPASCPTSWIRGSARTKVDPLPEETAAADPGDPGNYTNPFGRTLPDVVQKMLKEPWRRQPIPVVQILQRPGSLPCDRSHFVARGLHSARTANSVVYLIGPEECAVLANELDFILDPFSEYRDVLEWFRTNIGQPVAYQVRWFVLRAFMERHAFPRVFYMDSDVLLFANITQLASLHFQRAPIVLSVRWPSLRSLGPSQYASTTVSGHVSMWTHDALCDFLSFFQVFFQEAVLFGERGNRTLVGLRPYSDMVVLGWYTHKVCWTKRPEDLHPQCVADASSGVNPDRSARIRGKYSPKFRVESFAMPRWCNATMWSERGWCVFDHGFSVQSPNQYFRFRPEHGDKLPTSMHYTYFEDWSKDGEKQKSPVQFLGVHFHAHNRGYLERGDKPSLTWGSNED